MFDIFDLGMVLDIVIVMFVFEFGIFKIVVVEDEDCMKLFVLVIIV